MAAVHQLQGVGNAAAALLEKLNIFTTDDLLFHLPRDYEDRSTIIPMNQLQVGRSYLMEGVVRSIDMPPGKRKSMAILLQDDFCKVTLRFYHIYKALTDRAKAGNRLRIFGEVRVGARGLELYHPEWAAPIFVVSGFEDILITLEVTAPRLAGRGCFK